MRVVILLVLIIPFLSFSQEEMFSKNQLKKDFEVFQGSLEDFHPGLYWYNSKKETDAFFHHTEEAITDSMNAKEYLRLIAQAVAKIGCSHTSVRPKEVVKNKFFPLRLMFDNKKAFYIRNYYSDSLAIPSGSEIKSIDGIAVDSLSEIFLNIIRNDGNRKPAKYFMLNNYFQYLYRDFISNSNQFDVEFINYEGDRETIILDGLTYKEIIENTKINHQGSDPRNIILTPYDSQTAHLKIKQFADWSDGESRIGFENQLKIVFQSLDSMKIENLIIDLRGNGGGKVPWLVYSYFVEESFLFAKKADFIFTKKSPYYQYQELHPAMKWINMKWLNSWLPGSNKMKRINGSNWELTGLFMTKNFQPSNPNFDGEVYLLINSGTSSAASDFAALMKSNKLAVVLGEESGGGYYGNTSMEKSYVTLPNTKIRLAIPLVRHQLNVKKDVELGRGVIPDHFTSRTLKDELTGIDTELIFTYDLIKQKNLPK